jgi:Asp-tRNA(Asn)/Glu-tRNA(Gln) amidotransferase A subunit family amidase
MLANTAQFDCTHHPAMSLPCGMADGLPVGTMLVAKAFDEETIYRAGRLRAWRRLEDTYRIVTLAGKATGNCPKGA